MNRNFDPVGVQPSFRPRVAFSCGLIVAMLAMGSMAHAQKPEDKEPVDPFVAQGRERQQKSEWDLLLQDCDKILQAEPTRGAAILFRGIALNGKGEYDNAIKEFARVLELPNRDPIAIQNRADAYSNRSTSYYQKGEYLKAVDNAYFALLEKSNHADAHNNRGIAYVARRQYDKAIVSFDRALQANPRFAEAYSNRGFAYGAKGNFDQVIADQNKAIEIEPKLAIAYQRRGAAYVAKGDATNAQKDLDQALTIKPDFPDALCDRALYYGIKGDLARAMADLDAALKLDPRCAKAHFQKGRAYVTKKDLDQAIVCFDKAISAKDNEPAYYSFRGLAHQARKEHEAAISDFTKAIELDPKMEAAYKGRSESYKKLGKSKEERADLAKLKELHPAPPPKNAKKTEELPPRFLVTSKGVSPGKRGDAMRSAKEIDRLVGLNYAKFNVKPNPKASDSQFLRRVYLDITGTIPTYQQTQKFLAAHEPDKRSRLIDDLLASDGYASHYFNYWADVLRYTDNLNNSVRGEPYRQWIKQSLAENKPWDKFVYEIMTSEGLIWKNPSVGYFQRDANMPLDNMNNTVRIFLGTRIGCAQCHDHPTEHWTQKEFYQMAAFTFGTVTNTGGNDKRYWEKNPSDRLQEEYAEIEQEEEDRRQNSYRFDRLMGINMMIVNDQTDRKIRLPKDYKYTDAKPEDLVEPKTVLGGPAEIRSGETPRQAFARWLTSKQNPRFAMTIANRLWKQAMGTGQIEPVDDILDKSVPENPELMTYLESEMKRLDFDMKEYLRIIFNTEVYQREACSEEVPLGEPYHYPGPNLRRMTAEQAWDSFLTLAVVDPDEYREMPAKIRTEVIGLDLNAISAKKMLEAEFKSAEIDGSQYKRQTKYTYKGVLLARASELPSPVPASHFLRMFGQSDRELISASATAGSVPQVLFMFNGPITHMLLEKNSTIYNNVMRRKSPAERVKVIFLTILNREPDEAELELAKHEVSKNELAGYGNLIWSLVNTREFLFVQ